MWGSIVTLPLQTLYFPKVTWVVHSWAGPRKTRITAHASHYTTFRISIPWLDPRKQFVWFWDYRPADGGHRKDPGGWGVGMEKKENMNIQKLKSVCQYLTAEHLLVYIPFIYRVGNIWTDSWNLQNLAQPQSEGWFPLGFKPQSSLPPESGQLHISPSHCAQGFICFLPGFHHYL